MAALVVVVKWGCYRKKRDQSTINCYRVRNELDEQ